MFRLRYPEYIRRYGPDPVCFLYNGYFYSAKGFRRGNTAKSDWAASGSPVICKLDDTTTTLVCDNRRGGWNNQNMIIDLKNARRDITYTLLVNGAWRCSGINNLVGCNPEWGGSTTMQVVTQYGDTYYVNSPDQGATCPFTPPLQLSTADDTSDYSIFEVKLFCTDPDNTGYWILALPPVQTISGAVLSVNNAQGNVYLYGSNIDVSSTDSTKISTVLSDVAHLQSNDLQMMLSAFSVAANQPQYLEPVVPAYAMGVSVIRHAVGGMVGLEIRASNQRLHRYFCNANNGEILYSTSSDEGVTWTTNAPPTYELRTNRDTYITGAHTTNASFIGDAVITPQDRVGITVCRSNTLYETAGWEIRFTDLRVAQLMVNNDGSMKSRVTTDNGASWSDWTTFATGTIPDGSITTEKLADNAVTSGKLSADLRYGITGGGYRGKINTSGGTTTLIRADGSSKRLYDNIDLLMEPVGQYSIGDTATATFFGLSKMGVIIAYRWNGGMEAANWYHQNHDREVWVSRRVDGMLSSSDWTRVDAGAVDSSTFVKTTDAQTIAGVKTFSAADVHSAGISITGVASKLSIAPGTSVSTVADDNLKIVMGANASGVTPGTGGDLSLVLYRSGAISGDFGLGVTSNALNIRAGAGVINHFVNTKNVLSLTANGANNFVMLPQNSPNGVVTATTELGVKAYTNAGGNCGFEFRQSATQVVQFVISGTQTNPTISIRKTSNNGTAWTAFATNCDSLNTGWF
jgi:hypothetical protein